MSARNFRYRIVKTRNRYSRAVLHGDTVIIRLAGNMRDAEAREHISDLLRRMTKIVLEEQRTTKRVDPFRALLNGQQQLTVKLSTGRKYTFKLVPGNRSVARRRGNIWTVSIAPGMRREGLHRLLWRALAASEKRALAQLVHELNDKYVGVSVRNVRLQFATSQWGSCSHRGVIMLNTALLFLPRRLLHYVIFHELCHRIRADHSTAYWNALARVMPTSERWRQELTKYRLPSLS